MFTLRLLSQLWSSAEISSCVSLGAAAGGEVILQVLNRQPEHPCHALTRTKKIFEVTLEPYVTSGCNL